MTQEHYTSSASVDRKPRIALMGEFSAGKSTLANILMGQTLSPVQVTATQLPPIWYSKGDGGAVRITMDGVEVPLERDATNTISLSDTQAIRIFVEADILDSCDIIDMPGSSDPNISVDIWQSMLPMADGVLWCTPATQAWRQSEAAMWEEADDGLRNFSLLLLTRIDKILSAEDRHRLLRRAQAETSGQFRAVHPVSLSEAQEAGDDPELWRASGMADVLETLHQIITELEPVVLTKPKAHMSVPSSLPKAHQPKPKPVAVAPAPAANDAPTTISSDAAGVMPRRVMSSGPRTQRPASRRAAASGSLI